MEMKEDYKRILDSYLAKEISKRRTTSFDQRTRNFISFKDSLYYKNIYVLVYEKYDETMILVSHSCCFECGDDLGHKILFFAKNIVIFSLRKNIYEELRKKGILSENLTDF